MAKVNKAKNSKINSEALNVKNQKRRRKPKSINKATCDNNGQFQLLPSYFQSFVQDKVENGINFNSSNYDYVSGEETANFTVDSPASQGDSIEILDELHCSSVLRQENLCPDFAQQEDQSIIKIETSKKKKLKKTNNDILIKGERMFEKDIKHLQDILKSPSHQKNKSSYSIFQRLIHGKYFNSLVKNKKSLDKIFRDTKKNMKKIINKFRTGLGLVKSMKSKIKPIIANTPRKSLLNRERKRMIFLQNLLSKWNKEETEFFTDISSSNTSSINHSNTLYNSEITDEHGPPNPESSLLSQCELCNHNFVGCNLSHLNLSCQTQPDMNEEQRDPSCSNLFQTEWSADNLLGENEDCSIIPNPQELKDKELKDAKEEVVQLLYKLKRKQEELELVRKEMNDKINYIQGNANSEKKKMTEMLERYRDKLQTATTEMNEKVNSIQKNAESEQKKLVEKLKRNQGELETVRMEMKEKMNSTQEITDSEQRKMAVQLAEIREMLVNKITATNQIAPIFEKCLKGVTCQGILWDIHWLVEEGVQLKLGTEVTESEMAPNYIKVTQNEMHMVILIAFLLKVFPISASTEFIYSYIHNVDAEMSQRDVENLLNKFPAVFRGECFDVKPLEKKWRYLNFSPVITI